MWLALKAAIMKINESNLLFESLKENRLGFRFVQIHIESQNSGLLFWALTEILIIIGNKDVGLSIYLHDMGGLWMKGFYFKTSLEERWWNN